MKDEAMPNLIWVSAVQRPPAKERLLLIVSAAGSPPDAQLIGTSEVVVGYWTGDRYMPMTVDPHDLGATVDAVSWAKVETCLPEGTRLRPHRRFDPDVRE